MLWAEQLQCLICFAVKVYEAVQHCRVASYRKLRVMLLLRGNPELRRPLLIRAAEPSVPGKTLQGCRQHPFRALETVFLQHRL